MAPRPKALTKDHFSKYWNYVAQKRRWSIKKAVIRSISVPVGQVLFFFVFAAFAYGAAYSMIPGMVHRYILEVPALASLWTDFEAVFFASAVQEQQRLLLTAAALYLLPFSAALVCAVAVWALYHPRTPSQTGDHNQDAWQLWVMAKHAQHYAQRKESRIANDCAAFAGMLSAVAVLGYLLYCLNNPATKYQVIKEAHNANAQLFLYAAGLFFSYKLLNLPLHFLLKLLHFCHVPKNLVSVTEAYYHSQKQTPPETANSDP